MAAALFSLLFVFLSIFAFVFARITFIEKSSSMFRGDDGDSSSGRFTEI